jgi:hypothetical protein
MNEYNYHTPRDLIYSELNSHSKLVGTAGYDNEVNNTYAVN